MTSRTLLPLIVLCVASLAQSQETPNGLSEDWATFAEKSDYRETPRYDATVQYAKRIAAGSDLVKYVSFRKSSEGRDLPLLVASNDSEFDPAAARRNGKAIVLVQAAIHSGESDGKDAGLALLRDIAISKSRIELLDDVVILFIPIYNVDGHELFSAYNRINQNGPEKTGFRANSAYLNLNRDYLKADTPEIASWLHLWNLWQPDFFIDCHVTDGADFRYNITYEFAHHAETSPSLLAWMNSHFEKNIVRQVERDGNLLSRYLQFADRADPQKGIFTFIATPRFATGYTPLRNRNGLLIEAHSLKNYRSRVRGTYDLVRRTIEEIGRHKASLFDANRAADEATINSGKTYDPARKFPLRLKLNKTPIPFKFKGVEIKFRDSAVSGSTRIIYGEKPIDISIPRFDNADITASVSPPLFYVVPPQWGDVIKRLDLHGIEYQRFAKAAEIEIEGYRIDDPKWASAPFEGRLTMTFKTMPLTEKRSFPKNSVLISMAQINAKTAIHLLEPNAPDSLLFWGFFNSIFEQKEYSESYVMEEIAKKMLEKDESLRREFEERLKDPEFAKSPRARLRFFYRRSPYYDKRIGVYPVGRIVNRDELLKIDLGRGE